ncbi:MAG: hypothetical protein RBR78_00035 [Flavobacteriaceae bacterium]|jgi:hypothetical protein|nr:hypothetical protein [Flavobacteriaceae bacterium]
MPTTAAVTNRFYPTLDTIITEQDIPEILGFIREGLVGLLEKIHYKDYQSRKSVNGDAAFYSLQIVSSKKLSIEIPGTGIALVLNPNLDGSPTSAFPITVEYQWKALGYLKMFNNSQFSFQPQEIFEMALLVLNISQEQAIVNFINIFVIPEQNNTPLQQFVQDINDANDDLNILLPTTDAKISEVVQDIQNVSSKYPVILAFASYILDSDIQVTLNKLKTYFKSILPDDIDAFVKDILIPKFKATLTLIAAVEFPRNLLQPVYDENGVNPFNPAQPPDLNNALLVIPADSQGYPKVLFTFAEALFYVNTERGFGYSMELALNSVVPAQIGNTGLIINIQNLKLDLSTTSNIPEADEDGRSPEFMGFYTDNLEITLPRKWFKQESGTTQTLRLAGRRLLIGSGGGVSGLIALEAVEIGNPIGAEDFFWFRIFKESGFRIGFNRFDITFKQNQVVSSNIRARLEVPKLRYPANHPQAGSLRPVDVIGYLGSDGDFNLTASVAEGLDFDFENFFKLTIYSLELGKTASDDFYLGTSVAVSFPQGLMHELLGDQKIVIPRLRIYSNGRFEIEGGSGMLPVSLRLPLGPVEINVTGIHLGSVQRERHGVMRNYNYIGFDGGISIDPFGIDARGEGVKYYYTTDNDEHNGDGHSFIHIKTLYIDVVVPANTKKVSISGMLTIPEPGVSPEYQGSVEFKVNLGKSEGLSGSAAMRLAPRHPAFLVDAEVTLPKPIIFGSVGIYGFRGLIGYRYVAEKAAIPALPPQATWYDYYKHPQKGINIGKFTGPYESARYTNPFSFGAGAVIGTSFDDGTIVNARLMLLLSLPSMFMLEGRASILSSRLGLTDAKEPAFWAMLAWGDNSVEFGMGADFRIPQNSGRMFELNANAHAYFPLKNSKNWYVHIGTRENPNTAVLFKEAINLRAMSYLMLSNQGMELGSRVDFQINKRFFGIRVKLWAFIEVGAFISFERPQLGGYIHLGGGIEVNFWRMLYAKFTLDAYLGAELLRPYLIYARLEFKGKVRVMRFLRIRFRIKLTIKWEKSKELYLDPIPPLYIDGQNSQKHLELVKGVHMLTYESFDLNYFGNKPTNPDTISAVVPLDTYIDLKFTKGVNPAAISGNIGGHTSGAENFIELMPPKKTVKGGRTLRQVTHNYSIENIEIQAWDGVAWKNYHPAVEATDDAGVSHIKTGYWQRHGNQYDTLRILGNTIFSHTNNDEPGWFIPEQYGITASNLFCEEHSDLWKVSNVLNKLTGTTYSLTGQTGGHLINGAYYLPIGEFAADGSDNLVIPYNSLQVTDWANPFNYQKSLSFGNLNGLRIVFPEDSVEIKLKLTSTSQQIKVKIFKSISITQETLPQFVQVHEMVLTPAELQQEISYQNPDEPFCRIDILPLTPEYEAIQALQEQIESLYTDTYEDSEGVVNVTLPNDVMLYNQLLEQLNQLIAGGCGEVSRPCQNYNIILCQLYDALTALNCFTGSLPTKYDEVPQDCIKAFTDTLNWYITNHEQDCYPVAISAEYNQYSDQLPNIANYHGYPAFEDYLVEYIIFVNYANNLLLLIYTLGDCGCTEEDPYGCTTSFQEIGWKTWLDYQYELTMPDQEALNESYQAMIQGLTEVIQPVWRPNTAYCISLTLKDVVNLNTPHLFHYHYGFRTRGPIGHFHDADGVGYGNEYLPDSQIANRKDMDEQYSLSGKLTNPEKYPMTNLASYIDYRKSYPNPDSNLIMSKPVFYGNQACKIGLFFIKPYLPLMFKSWRALRPDSSNEYPVEIIGALSVTITDPLSEEIIPYPLPSSSETIPLPVPVEDTEWTSDDDPRIPTSIQLIMNLIQNGTLPCGIDLGEPIPPLSYSYQVMLTNLKPEKLYTATINNVYDNNADGIISDYFDTQRNIVVNEVKPVHTFVFKTSKYSDFESQINSYKIYEDNIYTGNRVYTIYTSISESSASDALQILQGDHSIAAHSGKQDPFDRIIESIFRLPPLAPAIDTEFLTLKSENQITRALLIRNPEPFNIPKIERETLNDSFVVLNENHEPLSDFHFLYSKDRSQILAIPTTLEIVSQSYIFRFLYKNWNGYTYASEAAVETLPIQFD